MEFEGVANPIKKKEPDPPPEPGERDSFEGGVKDNIERTEGRAGRAQPARRQPVGQEEPVRGQAEGHARPVRLHP
eukprot:9211326-Alexandrium_andersonii.AAC.1